MEIYAYIICGQLRCVVKWGAVLLVCAAILHAQPLNAQSFTYGSAAPSSRVATPFGFGVVRQTMVGSGTWTGNQICKNQWGTSWTCLSVSGGNLCTNQVPLGEVVSCNPASTPPVNQSAFVPQYNCYGQLQGPIGKLGSEDWCLVAGLQASLVQDSIYLYDDWVRIGIDRRFGGTVFELYGSDEKNRIMENGGGAIQLSLWGNGTSPPKSGPYNAWFVQPSSISQCSAAAYSSQQACQSNGGQCRGGVNSSNMANCETEFACSDNGANAGAPINPTQAISANCSYGTTRVSHDEARVSQTFSPQPNVIVTTKSGPQDFLKSSNDQLLGLFWTETSHVNGPFAMLSYSVSYSAGPVLSYATQEIPAIWLNDGFNNGVLYFYEGQTPYQNANSSVTSATAPTGQTIYSHFFLPGRAPSLDPLVPGKGAQLTEDWVTLCDPTSTTCITVATFSPGAQDITYIPSQDSYFSVHGDFALSPGLKKTVTIWIAPYRWDELVDGYTIRQWVYMIGGKSPSPSGSTSAKTRSLINSLKSQSKRDTK